ncbi:ABC transporter substrate-binding protein [Corynebacterium sp. A21]|uniref:ABC transporter substrate-binding protein n=1 Tax=Corynebacterium sp. A21 TaxID=3457318 RepID=UPI003FD32028
MLNLKAKKLSIVTAATAFGLALTACGETSNLSAAAPTDGAEVAEATDIDTCDPNETIKVSYNSLATEPMDTAIEAMGERFPELTIDATPSASTDYGELTQQIVSDIAVGNRPDVIMSGLGQMQFWVDSYAPNPVDVETLPEDYQTQFLGAGTARDGVTYLAPAQISAPVMAVNQDILDEAVAGNAEDIKTYEDLLKAAQLIADNTDFTPVSLPPQGLPEWFTQAILQNSGADMAKEDGTAAFGDEAGIAALDIWSELSSRGLEAGVPKETDAINLFGAGELGLSIITTSNIANLQSAIDGSFNWTPIRLPSIDGVQDRPLPAGGNGYMVLSEDSCRAAFSSELVSELLQPETVMQASGTQRSYIPVSREAREELLASDAATPQMTFAWTFENELTQWGDGFPGEHTAAIYDAIQLMDEKLQQGDDTATVVTEAVDTIDGIVGGTK